MNNHINWELILKKFTHKGLLKFISIFQNEDLLKYGKEKLIELLKDSIGNENKLFDTIDKELFLKFYRDTEEGGQKYFYFYNLDLTSEILKNLEKFKLQCINEKNRNFNTLEDETWFYRESKNEIIFKVTSVKKIFKHNKDLDDYNDDETKFFMGYNVFHIHNIIFFKFILNKNIIIIGSDKYSDLETEKQIDKKVIDKLNLICGKEVGPEDLIEPKHIEELYYLPNTIVPIVHNSVNEIKKSAMKTQAIGENMDNILKDIDSGKYTINQIKDENGDLDILTHPTYRAEQDKKNNDNSMSVKSINSEIYWFTKEYGIADCFKIKIKVEEDSSKMITYSSSITSLELENVISKIISS